MADKEHTKTDQKLEKMERHLSAIYSRARREIQKTADEYFKKFEEMDQKKRELVNSGKLDSEEYKKWRRGKIMYGKRFEEMKDKVAKQLLNVNKTSVKYINGELPDVYALNYNALESVVDGVGGYSFTLTDADTVRNLAAEDKTMLPYKYVDGKRDVRWNTKKVNSEVLQGIMQGDSISKIARRLQNVTEMNRVSAIRNARTTVTSAESKGRQDSYERAEKDGIILKREWVSTNDGRTRHTHRLLDGQIAEIDQPFQSELGPIMYPGDPTAAPANVYNCRCTVIAKVVGFAKKQVQKAKDVVYEAFESGKSAADYFKNLKSYKKWENGLEQWESNHIKSYCSTGYEQFNNFLRGKQTKRSYDNFNKFIHDGMEGSIQKIDNAISRFNLEKDIKVYRTCKKGMADRLTVGEIFHDAGYTSTAAIKEKVARGTVRMEIDVPKGSGVGAWVNELSYAKDKEYEFLLARGTDFEVTEIKKVKGETWVKMKVVGNRKDDLSLLKPKK